MDRADIARLNSYQDTLARQAGADIQKLIEKLVKAVDSVDELRDALLEAYPVFLADRGEQVAAASAEWYDKLRQAEIGGGTFATLPPSIPQEQAVATVRSAIALAYQGQAEQFVATLVDRTIFAVKRQGPATIAHNALRDPAAKRFARVPRGKTCAWCSMLASRGWVYTSAKAAGELGQYHSRCDCQIVPSFGRKPPKIAGYAPEALYKDYMAARESVIVRGDDLTANNIAAEMRRLPGGKYRDSSKASQPTDAPVTPRRFRKNETGVNWARTNLLGPTRMDDVNNAANTYTGSSYREWNAVLRDQAARGLPLPGHYEALTRDMDELMRRYSMPETIELHRGASAAEFKILGKQLTETFTGKDVKRLKDSVQTQPSYMSTSIGAEAAFGGDFHIHFTVPKGTPGFNAMFISQFGEKEREVLLGRGLRYKITRVAKAKGRRWKYDVWADILPLDTD